MILIVVAGVGNIVEAVGFFLRYGAKEFFGYVPFFRGAGEAGSKIRSVGGEGAGREGEGKERNETHETLSGTASHTYGARGSSRRSLWFFY